MTATTRTIVVSAAISAAVGIALGLTFILIGLQDEPGAADAAWLLGAAALASIPLSVPLGLVGAVVASLLLKSQRSRAHVVVWIIRGVGVGGFLGALSPALLSLFEPGTASGRVSTMDPTISFVAAASGVIAGGIVAVWCYWSQENTATHQGAAWGPPNHAMQRRGAVGGDSHNQAEPRHKATHPYGLVRLRRQFICL